MRSWGGRERGRRRVSVAFVVVAGIASVLATQLTGTVDGPLYRTAFQSVALAGVLLAVTGVIRRRRELGLAGLLIAVSACSSYIGDIGWTINALVLHAPAFPSWTAGFYLLGHVAFMACALVVIRYRKAGHNVAAVIDAGIVTVGVGVLAYSFVIATAFDESAVPALTRLLSVAYPLCDILVVGLLARLLFGSAVPRGPVIFLAGSMLCQFAGDIGFTLATLTGARADRWVDSGFLMFYLLLGYAVWHPQALELKAADGVRPEKLGRVRITALAAGVLLAPVSLLVESLTGREQHVRAAAAGSIVLFLLTLARISLLARAVELQGDQLTGLARTDSLTGLANRRTFDFALGRALITAGVMRTSLSVALIDLDHFKLFNDSYGHGAGDQLLREAAAAWLDELHRGCPAGTLSRYGGEEFAVILPGLAAAPAMLVLRRMLSRTPSRQTFSAGVADWDGRLTEPDLLNLADRRLYQAKTGGRKQVVGPVPSVTVSVTSL